MTNVEMKVEGDTLVIRVALTKAAIKAAQISQTGKTRLLASTHGAIAVGQADVGAKVALNVMIPR